MSKMPRLTKPRRTLKYIEHYPGPLEIYNKIMSSPGWPYKTDIDFYMKRDRALVALFYLVGPRVSEAIRLTRNQFVYPNKKQRDRIIVRGILLSKAFRKDKPRKHVFRSEAFLDLYGDKARLTGLVLDYLDIVEGNARLFLISRSRAHQIVTAMLGIPCHWLRAYCENNLYDSWDHDLLAVSDYLKIDLRTLQLYIRSSYKKYTEREKHKSKMARKE